VGLHRDREGSPTAEAGNACPRDEAAHHGTGCACYHWATRWPQGRAISSPELQSRQHPLLGRIRALGTATFLDQLDKLFLVQDRDLTLPGFVQFGARTWAGNDIVRPVAHARRSPAAEALHVTLDLVP
jgi:hypothetical protein